MIAPENLAKIPEDKRQQHEEMLRELVGRFYESVDVCREIEVGRFHSLTDLANHLKTNQGRLDRTIRAAIEGECFEIKDCCVVLKD